MNPTLESDAAYALASVSRSGTLVYQSDVYVESQFELLDRSGKTAKTLGPPGRYTGFRVSPDEKHIALTRIEPSSGLANIWVADLTRETFTRLTHGLAMTSKPYGRPTGRI